MPRPAKRRLTLQAIHDMAEGACFVAMDFSPKFKPVYDEVIVPAVMNAGLTPVRSDEVLSAAGNVVEEIIGIIQSVRMVIVEITGLNPNVLIELGIAQALRRPVILLTQDASVPFDIQPRRVLRYDLSTAGRRLVKGELLATIQTSVHPTENALQAMFPLHSNLHVLVSHGAATQEHISKVHPPVADDYLARLQRRSSETSGLWDISVALQRVATSRRLSGVRAVAANAHQMPLDALGESGFLVVLGGPGANPLFSEVERLQRQHFDHTVSMTAFAAGEGRQRYRVTVDGQPCPDDQDEQLAQHVDHGMVVRLQTAAGGWIWVAAGVRAPGTAGAIQALTTPALIMDMFAQLPGGMAGAASFGAVVRTQFDPVSFEPVDVSVLRCLPLAPRT